MISDSLAPVALKPTKKSQIAAPVAPTKEHWYDLTPADSLKLHSKLILEATNKIRTQISSGAWDGLTPKQIFFRIYNLHNGSDISPEAERLYKIIAMFSHQTLSNGDVREATLSEWATATDISSLENGLRAEEFEGENIRTSEIANMPRYGTMLGVPAASLKVLAPKCFQAAESIISQAKSGALSTLQRIRLALCLSVIMDILHLKPDLNGRSTEDFMVALQHLMLDDDSAILTWSHDGLRAIGVEKVISADNQTRVEEHKSLMDKRDNAMIQLRSTIYERLQQRMAIKGITEVGQELTQEIMLENHEVISEFFSEMLDLLIGNPRYFFVDFYNWGFNDLFNILIEESPQPYQYINYDYYTTHSEPTEPFKHLQQSIQKTHEAKADELARTNLFAQKIPDLATAQDIIESLLASLTELPETYVAHRYGTDPEQALIWLITFQLQLGFNIWTNQISDDATKERLRDIVITKKLRTDSRENIIIIARTLLEVLPIFFDYLASNKSPEKELQALYRQLFYKLPPEFMNTIVS